MGDHSRNNQVVQAVTALLAIAALYGLLFACGITCPIKYLTGISCPGCGMSRACAAVLRGDLRRAAAFHPLWILPPLAVIYLAVSRLLCRERPGRKTAVRRVDRVLLIIAVAAMLICYALRLACGGQDIVVFRPSEGLIYRVFSYLIH